MANYAIGDMIYETRVTRGYSQEELGNGICSVSSLSRIENGQQVPSKRMFDALMQRLGVSDSLYSAFISKEEMELYRLTQKLAWRIERGNYNECGDLIRELESRIRDRDMFERQYLLLAKACVLYGEKKNNELALELYLKAIQITMPDFEPKKGIKRRLLTFTEITLINGIALILCDCDEEMMGLRLMMELKEYMDEHEIDEEEKAKKYPMIVYNITTRYGRMGLHREVYKLCGETINYCVKCNKLAILPYLFTNKACAAAELEKVDEARECFKQASVLFQICGKKNVSTWVQQEASSKYGIHID